MSNPETRHRFPPESDCVHVDAKVNGLPVSLWVDLAWDDIEPADRPSSLVDFGFDFWPEGRDCRGRPWTRFFARRACDAVARAARESLCGGILVGQHLGLGQIGTLVALPETRPDHPLEYIIEYEKRMKRGWPWHVTAYDAETSGDGRWERYERLAVIARNARGEDPS